MYPKLIRYPLLFLFASLCTSLIPPLISFVFKTSNWLNFLTQFTSISFLLKNKVSQSSIFSNDLKLWTIFILAAYFHHYVSRSSSSHTLSFHHVNSMCSVPLPYFISKSVWMSDWKVRETFLFSLLPPQNLFIWKMKWVKRNRNCSV